VADPGYGPLFRVLLLQFGLGLPVGVLALRLLDVADDRREQWFAGLAAAGAGFVVFAGVAGIVTLSTGRAEPRLYHAAWVGLVGILAVATRRARRPTRAELGGAALALLLALPLGWLVYGPVRDFPVAPDYDGTADGYLAAIVKLGERFPRFHPLGDDAFIEVNVPPSVVCVGAYLSAITGVLVSRVELAQAGGAWIFYTLAVPFVAYPAFRGTPFPVAGPLLAAVLSYTPSFKWTYYDGSNTRLFGMLALLLATGFYLRALRGSRAGAAGAGIGLGLALYFHHRYFIFGALSMGLFGVARALLLAARGERAALAAWLRQAAWIGAPALLLAGFFLWDKVGSLGVTSQHPMWGRSRFATVADAWTYVARFQSAPVFLGGIVAALVALGGARRSATWTYLACALLVQAALCFETGLPPAARTYVDGATTAVSGFSDVRPAVVAALLLAPAGVFAAGPVGATRRRWGLGAATAVAVAVLAVTVAMPISSAYAFLTPGDVAALGWLREHTPREGTLVLNYPWDDLPDPVLVREYGVPRPRLSINFETFWVTPVAERRAVFHWVNRHLHQRAWNVVRAHSPDLPERLDALGRAYLNPCTPDAEATLRRNRVTHVFVNALLHVILRPKLAACDYLRLAYLAPPPFHGYYGRDASGYRPPDPSMAAAIYEVAPR